MNTRYNFHYSTLLTLTIHVQSLYIKKCRMETTILITLSRLLSHIFFLDKSVLASKMKQKEMSIRV
jgi:hypothetical protein